MVSFKVLRSRLFFDFKNDRWRVFTKDDSLSKEMFDSVYDALNFMIYGN